MDAIKTLNYTEPSFSIRSHLNEVCNHVKNSGRGSAAKLLQNLGQGWGEGPGKIMTGGSTTKADYLTVPPTKLLWIRLKKWVI